MANLIISREETTPYVSFKEKFNFTNFSLLKLSSTVLLNSAQRNKLKFIP